MIRGLIIAALWVSPSFADTLVAARTIPARTIIGPNDVLMRDIDIAGGLDAPSLAVGQEARVALYAGRPIRLGDIGQPAIVERNQIVTLVYRQANIVISTEGRALDRAGFGDLIPVMNLTSRTTVTARIDETGTAVVAQ